MVQIPIEIGYRFASIFAKKSAEARKNAEMLGLMVKDPNILPEELKKLRIKTLVIAGFRDMIKTSHTRLIAEKIPNSELAILPGDHFIANKNFEQFNQAIERFLIS